MNNSNYNSSGLSGVVGTNQTRLISMVLNTASLPEPLEAQKEFLVYIVDPEDDERRDVVEFTGRISMELWDPMSAPVFRLECSRRADGTYYTMRNYDIEDDDE